MSSTLRVFSRDTDYIDEVLSDFVTTRATIVTRGGDVLSGRIFSEDGDNYWIAAFDGTVLGEVHRDDVQEVRVE